MFLSIKGKTQMKVSFYGVRGSIATPGSLTMKYGGNTSCVCVELNSGHRIILDAGTGLRSLGTELMQDNRPLHLLLSHSHWDHIQGLPFFLPVYKPNQKISIYSGSETDAKLPAVLAQMNSASFPVTHDQLPSQMTALKRDVLRESLAKLSVSIRERELNHGGGGKAFRIEEEGVSIAYITDNELDPPGIITTRYEEWVAFAHGVDLLIHDAQYTEEDMPHKHGWGHSLISQVRRLAIDAEVKNLVMFHHDPERTDSQLEEIERENAAFFKSTRSPSNSIVAAEGMTLKLSVSRTEVGRHILEYV